MKTSLLVLAVGIHLLQGELNPNLMTETMAVQMASDFAEIKLRKEQPPFHSTKEGWQGVFRDGRWYMQYRPHSTAGWVVLVSFKADGSDKKLEGSGYSVE